MRVSKKFAEKSVVWESNDFLFWLGVYTENSESSLQLSVHEIRDMGLKDTNHKIFNFLRSSGLSQTEIGEVLFYSQPVISNALNSPSPKNVYLVDKN